MNSTSHGSSAPASSAAAADRAVLLRGVDLLGATLGAAEVAFPDAVTDLVGLPAGGAAPLVVRALGVRDLVLGAAARVNPRHAAPRWLRAVGHAVDLGLLGAVIAAGSTHKRRLAAAAGAVAGIVALDVLSARRTGYARNLAPARASVAIAESPEHVYEVIRTLEWLPLFMGCLDAVAPLAPLTSRWTARLTGGGTVSWNVEILDDRPGRLLVWQSARDASVQLRGRIELVALASGTEVTLELQLGAGGHVPARRLAPLVTRSQVEADVLRLKLLIETADQPEIEISEISDINTTAAGARSPDHAPDRGPGGRRPASGA